MLVKTLMTTVKELIDKLQKLPQEKYIFIESDGIHFKGLEVSSEKLPSPFSGPKGSDDFVVIRKVQ